MLGGICLRAAAKCARIRSGDMSNRAIYITRCDIGWYSKNANAYRKPLEVAAKHETTLYVSESCRVPKEIEEKCASVVRFRKVWDVLMPRSKEVEDVEADKKTLCSLRLCASALNIFTGFDFPCMLVGWLLKRKYGCQWTVFLWDPPSLSHRDCFPPLRWAIDFVFRFFAKRCDKLVLNIHPGLLDEIGYVPRNGQVELRMQDAWEGVDLGEVEIGSRSVCEYDFGVLSNWSRAKGGPLVAEALRRMPGKTCFWIGDAPSGKVCDQIEFAGRLPQKEAFERLKKCRILVAPYLPVRSLKWNYVLKLFEYLQLGRPILASDNPGNVAVSERYPGRISLFASGNPVALAERIKEICE